MESQMLQQYAEVAGQDAVEHLQQLSEPLKGMKVVHINSTRAGGGVAEILHKMVPLMQELGLDAQWEVITGEQQFYECTKSFHNAMQGDRINVPDRLLRVYEDTNRQAAENLKDQLQDADIVFVHDPQPAAMINHLPDRKGKWIWRCHIDASRPFRPVWKYLRQFVKQHDASIFSLSTFAQALPHPVYLIPPSIDPVHDKNKELDEEEIDTVCNRFNIDRGRPLLVQISRYDRFKDPLGVIQAYKLAKKFVPTLQLVLAGGSATDDPEGEAVLSEVKTAASDDEDIHVLLLPAFANTTINALQRAADIVLQKSIKEGFGLTVTEAMWKQKAVIGGNTGGIKIQVYDYQTGFLVNTPEGAALRIRYLLHHRDQLLEMGKRARQFVRFNFLLTRQVREYMTLIRAILLERGERIEMS